jgi:hypothetical protein
MAISLSLKTENLSHPVRCYQSSVLKAEMV